ncbi:MAG: cytochrome c oxidase assembly protein [Devosiaceae bacterium]|nr:cytochrome c oxidase assembly protein [Devosiaceae bacterium]
MNTISATHSDFQDKSRKGNLRIAIICASVFVGMVGLSFAAVPLYQLFCQITGYAGTTQVSEGNVNGIIDREMSVRFDVTVSSALDWTIVPASTVTDKIGEVKVVTYRATNNSDVPVTGTASFNVAPSIAGAYFNKIECFCFTEQTLAPGESVEMPITFFLDPELDQVRELDTVNAITLSYTFYASDSRSS